MLVEMWNFVKIGNDVTKLVWYDVTVRNQTMRKQKVFDVLVPIRLLLFFKYAGKKGLQNMKKVMPVLIALILIIVIGGVTVGGYLKDKYSYSTEQVDMNEYFGVSGEQAAIILQDEQIEEKSILKNGICYFDLATVHKYFNEIFYVDKTENLLLYTTATETIQTNIGETFYTDASGNQDMGFAVSYIENDTIYIAADFIKKYTNYSYEIYDKHIQVYTQWGTKQVAEITKDTQIRRKGGIKSPVLSEVKAGDTVEILEKMENWSKVKSADAIIGYVENKRLKNEGSVEEVPVADYTASEYTGIAMEGKVSLGWHSIGGPGGNSTLDGMVAGTKGMNVIAPTWFSMNDNEGGFRSFGSADYVARAHALGLQVWGVVDNFNYANETGTDVDVYGVLSNTTKRKRLAQTLVDTSLALGLDGINVDFEQLGEDCGIHFVQFLRELSVLCRRNQLILSVDNYVPFNFNEYYRLDIQGQIADYVIIMGYDEHWHGSGDPGSVASIDYVSNGITKTLEKVPANKVINALPFYTIVWTTQGATVTDEYLTISNTPDYLNSVGVQPVWDETTCQNYLEWTVGDKTRSVWLEDAESIKVKLNVMSSNNIAGVAVWRLGYGNAAVWELINAYTNS